MNTIAKVFLSLVGLLVVGLILLNTLFVRIHPWEYGVKQNLLGDGVVEKDFGTGFVLRIPGVHEWHRIDRRTHFVTFADIRQRTEIGMSRPSLEIRTKDNNLATYDLSVTYRVEEGSAYKIVQDRKKEIYKARVVDNIESTMREELAQLSSEEIFSTETRLRVANEALPRLAESLREFQCVPDQVLIRAVRFQDGYEARLQAKQLTYQKTELAESQRAVEDQSAITQTKQAEIEAAEKELRGEWDKRIQQAQSENQVKIAGVRAKANIYDQETRAKADASFEIAIAEGNLAIAKAEALRNELRNKALDTKGGRIFLAQQAAENLDFESVTLNSNDPRVPSVIDISAMVKLLIGDE
ncbi:SPFH domain / Band 7 family protein [Planctomycetes bacterium Poly30]|uniref:SPFH domain / Band 7 family protein n=1 Tax=Saltatorellus ferox TaxID=2528018 RepID=A0A518ELX5_9BACT|nr:SPFH domain / Band 7 family protein [Planctomycetes bacterium Poly30]